jgi:uncharacterized pyridoxamine 5'-phosphate oxidase family protein
MPTLELQVFRLISYNRNMVDKPYILNFLRKHHIGVISTISSDGSPEAAVIEVAFTDSFEIIFDTFNTYRKYANLKNNPKAAFVIGWDENITVQYEGEATELTGDGLEKYKKQYLGHNPDAQKWLAFKELVYFKVTPKWLRYRDGNQDPIEPVEISF